MRGSFADAWLIKRLESELQVRGSFARQILHQRTLHGGSLRIVLGLGQLIRRGLGGSFSAGMKWGLGGREGRGREPYKSPCSDLNKALFGFPPPHEHGMAWLGYGMLQNGLELRGFVLDGLVWNGLTAGGAETQGWVPCSVRGGTKSIRLGGPLDLHDSLACLWHIIVSVMPQLAMFLVCLCALKCEDMLHGDVEREQPPGRTHFSCPFLHRLCVGMSKLGTPICMVGFMLESS